MAPDESRLPEPGDPVFTPLDHNSLRAFPRTRRTLRIILLMIPIGLVLLVVTFLVASHVARKAMREALPQIDGTINVKGLAAPVSVERDAQGVPHIHAASLDDLVFAQGYVTAQDRLWQMDILRRHATGELAQILGRSLLDHDRLQRTLQIGTAADRAIAGLATDQRHWLDVYAAGVNASIDAQRTHLPIEFRLLRYQPSPWTSRDSLLIGLVMFQDLTTGFPEKLNRETLTARLPPELIGDLYPVGSWRDHAPDQPIPDLTAPQPEIEDVPLDESQTKLNVPDERVRSGGAKPGSGAADLGHTVALAARSPGLKGETWGTQRGGGVTAAENLLALRDTLALFHRPCTDCVAGSNNWAVAGSRTASGKPLLANDMHLSLSIPSLWYEADLSTPESNFHVAGVTLPGTPLVIVGHNDHVAWGFTNLGADVQDLYIEHTRGTPSGAEFQAADGSWHAITYHREVIHIRGAADVTLDVPTTRHGAADTPIISSIFPGEKRTLSLRWTPYEPGNVSFPFFAVNGAHDWPSMLAAFSSYGGPSQNLMYADDQGHIGYHAVGRIPIRGDLANPAALSPVPTDATAADAASHEWVGYIPFDKLPQALDPADGVLATANARITPEGYGYPITLNWMAPYRTERIYKVLEGGHQLRPADMLALQTDVVSVLDQVLGQRFAYAIDHTTGPLKGDKQLHQAADILRGWDGHVNAASAAPAIVNAARAVFWPLLLVPKLVHLPPQPAARPGDKPLPTQKLPPAASREAALWALYTWGEKGAVEEQLVMHTPARWLPPGYATWEDFLASVVSQGLRDAHAPADLNTWSQGKLDPSNIKHPIFSNSPIFRYLLGVATEAGPQPQSGDGTTIRQVRGAFGPSERFTADLGDLDRSTLNIVTGQSGNPASPWYLDQYQSWLHGETYALPFTLDSAHSATAHTLTLKPQ